MELCPHCNNEILPYLKTGEFKYTKEGELISYQLYFCVICKVVFFKKHESFVFQNLEVERENKRKEDAKKHEAIIGRRNLSAKSEARSGKNN